jgi:predicted permease
MSGKSRQELEMVEEFTAHLEMQTEENLRAGMDPQTARRQARIKFGGIHSTEDAWRDQRGVRWLEETVRDLRLGLLTLKRNPTFAAVTILTLGVTIGLNVAIYSVVERVLLTPLPFEQADRLVTMYNSFSGRGADRLANSVSDFFLRRERLAGLEESALYVGAGENVGEGDRTERVPSLHVTPSFFPTIGVRATLGRTFHEHEMDPGAQRSVILTDGYWREQFSSSPDVLGRTLKINGETATIVGVLPAAFSLPTQPDARLVHPLVFQPEQRSLERWGSNNDFFMVGRLAPGVTREQLETDMNAMYLSVAKEFFGNEGAVRLKEMGYRAVVVDAHEDLIRNLKSPLFILAGAVTFVLLIGCVNIATLMLARSEVRLPELATRAALGAGRLRLARQVVGEASVIGVLGGIVGVGLGAIALRLLGVAALSPTTNTDGETAGAMTLNLLRGIEGGLSGALSGTLVGLPVSVLAYSVALGLVTAILFAAIPVIWLFRQNVANTMAHEGRGRTRSRGSAFLRDVLVSGQVAIAFLLLVGAGLMLRSYQSVTSVNPGFEANGVFTGYTSLTNIAYPDGVARRAFYGRWLQEVRALSGVEAAAVTTLLPFGATDRTTSILPVGYKPAPQEPQILPNWAIVSPGYFDALGIEVLEGRSFEDRDGPELPLVVVLDKKLARHFWPDRSPLGQQMTGFGNRVLTVVGVVETIEQKDLAAAAVNRSGAFYIPFAQFPAPEMALVARPSQPGLPLAESIRAALKRVDPNVPLFDVRTLDSRLSGSVGSRRTPTVLLVAFAAVALFLAAVGAYGVLAYAVSQRTRETAIRIALGSRPAGIVGMVLKEGAILGGLGLSAGAVGAYFLVRLLQSMLFGIAPLDPTVLVITVLVLCLSIVLAAVVPAFRAIRVDPMTALKDG